MLTPSRKEFLRLALRAGHIPVARELTPFQPPSAALLSWHSARGALLDSARLHPVTGRFAYWVPDPVATLRATGRSIEVLAADGTVDTFRGQPLTALRHRLGGPCWRNPCLPPFVGGAVGYFGYGLRHWFERLPRRAADDLRLPELYVHLADAVVAWDHLEQCRWLVALADVRRQPAERAWEAALERLDRLEARCREAAVPPAPEALQWRLGEVRSNLSRQAYEAMVEQAKAAIGDGEIYQANVAQRWAAPVRGSTWGMYRRLRDVNPSPFAAYVVFDDVHLVGCSPERLFRIARDRIDTRPIAGTRPWSTDPAEQARLASELLLSPKERAEHIMLVDLERNDLGRICRIGSVRVDELMVLEPYSHVVHIVSNVCGRLRRSADWTHALAAMFPGGTITGTPKIRSMEIIDQLEPVARGPYTGSVGFLSATGDCDLNLAIRTAVVTGGMVYVHAGSGIVADSVPRREYEETMHKAEALWLAFRSPELARVGVVG